GLGFARRERLSRKADLVKVLQGGKRVRAPNLDARFLVSPLEHSRVGIVVPRFRHTAVDRNRLKRRLRELVRLHLLPALRARVSVDVAIHARREAYGARPEALRNDLASISAGVAP